LAAALFPASASDTWGRYQTHAQLPAASIPHLRHRKRFMHGIQIFDDKIVNYFGALLCAVLGAKKCSSRD